MFGLSRKKPQNNKERMAAVRRKGKVGEEAFKNRRETWGDKVERTGKGHDYKVTREDWITGKKSLYYAEVKTGKKAKPSKLQKATKKKLGNKYKVVRMDDPLGL